MVTDHIGMMSGDTSSVPLPDLDRPALHLSGPGPGESAALGGPGGLAGLPAARRALDRAVSHLTALQHPDGWWQGELETNVTMDAEDLLLREFLGMGDEKVTAASARWIRSQQRVDG